MIDINNYHELIGYQVITEKGISLGWFRGIKLNLQDNTTFSLVIASIKLPLFLGRITSTYEVSISEIYTVSHDCLVTFDGAEKHLNQLTIGILEYLGLTQPLWQRVEQQKRDIVYIAIPHREFPDEDWTGGISPSPRPRDPKPSPRKSSDEVRA